MNATRSGRMASECLPGEVSPVGSGRVLLLLVLLVLGLSGCGNATAPDTCVVVVTSEAYEADPAKAVRDAASWDQIRECRPLKVVVMP